MKTFQEWLEEIANIPSGDVGIRFKVGEMVYLKHHNMSGVKDLGMTKVLSSDKNGVTVEHPQQKNLKITVKHGISAEPNYSTKKGYYALHRDV